MSIGIPVTRLDEEKSAVAHINASTFNQTAMSTTNTQRRLAITPGEAHIMDQHEAGTHLKGFKVIVADGAPSAYVDANHAPLYCDANNTYNACGLTPSELLARLREAEAKIEKLNERWNSYQDHLSRPEP